jgi:hypothetical protein
MSERSHILVCAKQSAKKKAEIEENILFRKTNNLESNSYLVCWSMRQQIKYYHFLIFKYIWNWLPWNPQKHVFMPDIWLSNKSAVAWEGLVLMSERSHNLVCAKQSAKKQAEIEENILFRKTKTLESNSYLVC